MLGAFTSVMSPGLLVRSHLVGIPAWKSDWVVSVRQPLAGAGVSEKSCVVVKPSLITILVRVTELNPGKLTVMPG